MQKDKKFLAFLLSLCLTASAFSGCAAGQSAPPSSTAVPESVLSPSEVDSSAPATRERTREIVDQMGNTVVLPEEVDRVVIASVWPLASVYCLFEGSTEKLVGLDPAIISAAENSLLVKAFPEIVEIESAFSQNGTLNAEELLRLDPDVVLYASGVPEDYDVCQQAGIPAVGFSLSIKDFNAVDTINSWMELLGEVMGRDLTNNDFIQYGQDMQALVASRLEGLTDEEKPRCMFIHGYDAGSIRVPGSASWADYWITASGGINVGAQGGKGTPEVGIEQIYQWNPEKIFITNFNRAIPDDLYQNAMESFDWSSVLAVQKQQVEKLPLGMYRWYVTCSDSSLMLLWMAKQNHPDLFEDIDMNETVREFYEKFYGLSLTDEEIDSIFIPKREAAGGI